jgi:cytochrome c biogenesis factor
MDSHPEYSHINMNKSLKIIIFGFALMLFGGTFFITCAIYKSVLSYMVLFSYGLYIGFILILIGLLTYNKK